MARNDMTFFGTVMGHERVPVVDGPNLCKVKVKLPQTVGGAFKNGKAEFYCLEEDRALYTYGAGIYLAATIVQPDIVAGAPPLEKSAKKEAKK